MVTVPKRGACLGDAERIEKMCEMIHASSGKFTAVRSEESIQFGINNICTYFTFYVSYFKSKRVCQLSVSAYGMA